MGRFNFFWRKEGNLFGGKILGSMQIIGGKQFIGGKMNILGGKFGIIKTIGKILFSKLYEIYVQL